MMTDDKVMAWLKDKEKHIKNKAENRKYTFGVTLNTGDLSYIHRLQHILGARKGLMVEQSPQPCWFCLDASCDPEGELTTENDYSSLPVGSVAEGYRMSIDVGCGKPLRVCIEHWIPHMQQNELVGSYNELVGFYKPKFCPECGRCLK